MCPAEKKNDAFLFFFAFRKKSEEVNLRLFLVFHGNMGAGIREPPGPTWPNRSEIFKILLVMVRFGLRFGKFVRSWSGPRFSNFSWSWPGPFLVHFQTTRNFRKKSNFWSRDLKNFEFDMTLEEHNFIHLHPPTDSVHGSFTQFNFHFRVHFLIFRDDKRGIK